MKVSLRVSTLKAALYSAAKKDLRYYLNGVCLEFISSAEPHINVVATDGHRLGAFREPLEYAEGEQKSDFNLIIPRESVEMAIKSAGKRGTSLILESMPDGRYQLGSVVFDEVDGEFPVWQKIVPQSVTGETAYYNPEYLVDARDALRTYYGERASEYWLSHNGASPGVMQADADAMILIMPMRRDKVDFVGYKA